MTNRQASPSASSPRRRQLRSMQLGMALVTLGAAGSVVVAENLVMTVSSLIGTVAAASLYGYTKAALGVVDELDIAGELLGVLGEGTGPDEGEARLIRLEKRLAPYPSLLLVAATVVTFVGSALANLIID
jgi:hypothetical protein